MDKLAKLYGLSNQILSEMISRLITNKDFYKFVYYKDVRDKDILSMPDLEDPVSELYRKQVWLHRRPQLVLHEQDVHVFLALESFKNETAKDKRIKTIGITIGILVQENCLPTANGDRAVALLECVSDILESDDYFNGLGECRIVGVNHLFGLGLEYSGFEIKVKIDGLKTRKV